jgi:hypothetical protein
MELIAMDQINNENNDFRPEDVGVRSSWVVIAEAVNRTVAEFAVNGLKSYDIPAVIDSRAGFLGSAGLQLRSMRTGKVEKFKILVPSEYEEEAAEVVKIFLGEDNPDSDEENGGNPEESEE